MLCISVAFASSGCLSVCPSVTLLDCVETSTHILKTSGSPSGLLAHRTSAASPFLPRWPLTLEEEQVGRSRCLNHSFICYVHQYQTVHNQCKSLVLLFYSSLTVLNISKLYFLIFRWAVALLYKNRDFIVLLQFQAFNDNPFLPNQRQNAGVAV